MTNEYPACTCTYGAYIRHGGGTGWDIAKFDPECPVHDPPSDPDEDDYATEAKREASDEEINRSFDAYR